MKRTIDVTVSALLLLLTAPVLALAAAAVRVVMGRPILFRQVRPGLHGQPFTLLKLRTMTAAAVRSDAAIDDGQRLTRLGRFLRKASIDELPQLVNVLRGEMSLVGPRPLLLEYLPLYSSEQARRHEVRPGITGWTQINGRNSLSWDEKFALDVWYVDNRSTWLDVKILCLTAVRVVTGFGVRAAHHSTMPRFTGSSNSAGQRTPQRAKTAR
jgi:sugar transferase EpsL